MQMAPVPRRQQKSCYASLGLPTPLPPNPCAQDRGQTPVQMPMPAPAGSYPHFRTQHLTSLPACRPAFAQASQLSAFHARAPPYRAGCLAHLRTYCCWPCRKAQLRAWTGQALSPWAPPLPPHPSVDLSPACGDVPRGLAGSGEVT